MSRLSEAIFMANCSPNEWTKYAKTHSDCGQPFYLSAISREEAKRLRQIVRRNKTKIR